ncbi:MAG: hypothetical protein AAF065_02445 [Verrucomicrobiota bacterium]
MKLLPFVFTLLAGTGLGYLLFHEETETSESASLAFTVFEDGVPASYSVDENPGNSSVAPLAPMLTEEISDYGVWLRLLDDLPRNQQMARVYAAMASLSTSEYGDVIDSLIGVEAEQHQTFINGLFKSWAEIDPKGMLDYLDALPQDDARQKRRVEAMGQFAKVDFDAAWAYFQNLPNSMLFSVSANYLLNQAREYRPERVLQIIQEAKFKNTVSSDNICRNIFNSLGKSDPSRAQSLASNLPVGKLKTSALISLVYTIYGNKNTVDARAWLNSLPMDSSVGEALLSLNNVYHNPATIEEAEDIINTEPDAKKRRQIIKNMDLFGLLKGRSFDDVLQLYEVLEANGSEKNVHRFVEQMMAKDQARTVDFVLDLPLGQSRVTAIRRLASIISNQDLTAAMDFADSLDFEDERKTVLSLMTNSIQKNGPEKAIELLDLLDNAYLENSLAGWVSGALAEYDYDRALAWVDSIEDEKAFNDAQTSLVQTLAVQDMQQAVNYVLSDVAPKERDKFLSMSVLSISRKDPEEAIDWLNKNIIEDPGQLDRLYQDVTKSFMNADSMAASEWVASLETGPQRDSAVQGLVNNIVRYDPDSALIWSSTIENEKSRMNMMQSSVQQLLKKNPKVAEEAILDAGISDEERDELLKLVKS